MQPVVKLHPSSVQDWPSSQSSGVPETQVPATHVATPLHTLLSLQSASTEHVQLGMGAPEQSPALQESEVVQLLPSLQEAPSVG